MIKILVNLIIESYKPGLGGCFISFLWPFIKIKSHHIPYGKIATLGTIVFFCIWINQERLRHSGIAQPYKHTFPKQTCSIRPHSCETLPSSRHPLSTKGTGSRIAIKNPRITSRLDAPHHSESPTTGSKPERIINVTEGFDFGKGVF